MAIQRVVLSGSTSGRPITVAALAASCNMVVHTVDAAVTGADNVDEVWLWAFPYATATACSRQLFLQIGTDSTADMVHALVVRDQALPGPTLVLPGININNSLKITAWATACMDIGLVGHAFKVRA